MSVRIRHRADFSQDAVEIHPKANAFMRDEAGVLVHVHGGVRPAGRPQPDHLRQAHRFFSKEHDLLVDLETWRQIFLKKDVAGLMKLRCGEDFVDGHAGRGSVAG